MKAGIFDSGVGGLSVLKSIKDAEIFSEIVYFADLAHVPYGNKDTKTIQNFCLENLEFLEKFDVDTIIIACNTATACSLELLKSRAKCSVYGVIDAGVSACDKASANKDDKILVLGTKATISSGLYEKKLKSLGYHNITNIATSLFVPIVEEGLQDTPILNECMKHYFSGISTPDIIVLGCTHFPFLKEQISRYFNHHPKLIHSGDAIVDELLKDFKKDNVKPKISFHASSDEKSLIDFANKYLA